MNRKYLVVSLVVLIIILTVLIAVSYRDIYLSPDKTPAIACGYWHSFVLDTDGSAYASGANWNGQLGDGTRTGTSIPKKVQGIDYFKMIACGSNHTIAVKKDGTVWAWGNNNNGQLGIGSTEEKISPVKITALEKVRQVSCGDSFSVAVKEDGTVWAWGNNEYGQLGNGSRGNCYTPVQVLGLNGIKNIACGSQHAAAVKSDGTVWTWGKNGSGQLGDSTLVSQTSASIIMGLEDVESVSCGSSHTLALKSNGTIYAWGSNANGQLGLKDLRIQKEPKQVEGIENIKMIACGDSHSIALKDDGKVIAWGGGTLLGNNSSEARYLPAQVEGISTAVQVYANYNYSMALLKSGVVMAWGKNWKGQLGNGTTKDSPVPAQYLTRNSNDDNAQKDNPDIDKSEINAKKESDTSAYEYLLSKSNPGMSQKQWGLFNYGQAIKGDKGITGVDINIKPAWQMMKAPLKRCIVGVVDSGIDITHRDLKGNIFINKDEMPNNGIDDDENGYIDDINGWDFFNNDSSVFDSKEKDTHGTAVAGIIAAKGVKSGVVGVASNALVLPLKITEQGGKINITNTIKAIEYAQSRGVAIINCSFETSENSKVLENRISDTDAVFVCAAGNKGVDTATAPVYPACFTADNILSVAAIDNTGTMYSASNYGKRIHVAAPGVNIFTTVPGNQYEYFSGTSMAAPFVTGTAALIKSKCNNLSCNEILSAICNNVSKVDKLKDKVSSGGIVNAYNALKQLK